MKNNSPELIVMLTHNDRTVMNAQQIFELCKSSKIQFWGAKDIGLSKEDMKKLFFYMKNCGKTTILEVVSYTETEGMEGAKLAVECGCDIIMGTLFFDSINTFCQENNIKYMPFVGKVKDHPSVLEGTIEEMISEASEYIEKGVYGIDLLAYRYTKDVSKLIKEFVSKVNVPVCLAGGIDCYHKLDTVITANPWAFTIGSAFFENRFEGTFSQQVDKVYTYIRKNSVG